MECSKSDWMLFQRLLPGWQENYMERLSKEYITLLSGEGQASEKFWKLEERIKKDKKHPGVSLWLEKKNVIFDLVALVREEVIQFEDLAEFSEELQAEVKSRLEMKW